MKRVVVGVTGATGVIYGVRFLEKLRALGGVETHLILSDWARKTLEIETEHSPQVVERLADVAHDCRNMGASVASGSFGVDAMVVLPCSMKTLSAIANGYADNLIARAADVCLKEKRLLVLSPRETPLNEIHLENMLKLNRMGVRIIPPMPGFYYKPMSIDDLIEHHCMKILDALDIKSDIPYRWRGISEQTKGRPLSW